MNCRECAASVIIFNPIIKITRFAIHTYGKITLFKTTDDSSPFSEDFPFLLGG